MNIIETLEKEQMAQLEAKRRIPTFQPGDTLRVNVKVVEEAASASRPMKAFASHGPAVASTRASRSAKSPMAKAWSACFRSILRSSTASR